MKKIDLTHNDDGSPYVMADVHESQLSLDVPVRSYFEVKVVKQGNLAIELRSSTDSVLYDGLHGDVLESSTRNVLPGTPLSTGSIVGVDLWTFKKERGGSRSLCEFKINNELATSRALSIEGSNIVPSLYLDPKTAKVEFNTGDKKYKFDKGTHLPHYPILSI